MNVLEFTLCYPPGECHPDALLELPPEGVELSGNYEGYEFLTAHHVPEVGAVQAFADSGDWIITAVESYLPTAHSDLSGFYHAICTKDGKTPAQERSEGYTVLGVKMDGQELVWRAPGWADWWYGSELSIPKPSPTREVLTFTPRTDSSYGIVVVSRPVRMLQVSEN